MDRIKVIKSRRKTISIKITDDAKVVVRAPINMANERIIEFVEKNRKWIEQKVSKTQSILNRNNEIINFEKVLFLGRAYNVIYTNATKNIILNNNLYIPEKFRNNIKKHLKNWYIEQFDTVVLPRIDKYSDIMNLDFSSVSVISSVRKWGMCDSNRKLFFNYAVLMLNPEIIDYIVVHELSHLKEMNHSKRFWSIVGSYIPDYKEQLAKLKECGFLLRII